MKANCTAKLISALFVSFLVLIPRAIHGNIHGNELFQDSTFYEESGSDTAIDTTAQPLSVPKTRASRYSGAGFGPALTENFATRDLSYSFFIGNFWEVNQYSAIRIIADLTTDFDNAVLASLNLGLNLAPFPEDISPFVAADFGFGGGRGNSNNIFGFNISGAFGVILFRTTDIQLLLEAKASFLFDNLKESYPTIYTTRIGIIY